MRDASTRLVEELLQRFGPFQEPIIDLGGGESHTQFRHLFNYTVADLRQIEGVDHVVDARTMWTTGKFKTHSIGTVLTFDALEHIYEVQDVAKQIGMITIKGGMVVVGVPWMYSFHDPSGDYWRFSHQALERLFGEFYDELDCGYYDFVDGVARGSYYIGRRKTENRDKKDKQ